MRRVAPFSEPVDGAKPAPSSDPIALLNFALQNCKSAVHLVNFATSVVDAWRGDELPVGQQGSGGPPLGPRVAVSVPVGVLENLTGPPELQDAYILIHIERSVVDAMDEPRLNLILPPGMRRYFFERARR